MAINKSLRLTCNLIILLKKHFYAKQSQKFFFVAIKKPPLSQINTN